MSTSSSQQDPRGGFAFHRRADRAPTSLTSCSACRPRATIAFGNADKYLRRLRVRRVRHRRLPSQPGADDQCWSSLGVRVAVHRSDRAGWSISTSSPGFTTISPVLASDPTGSLTGETLSVVVDASRTGAACSRGSPSRGVRCRDHRWSSAPDYGIYRNTNVYQSIATLMAQQPPLSSTFSVPTRADNPFTLANGFVAPRARRSNTFAVDPDFRVGVRAQLAGRRSSANCPRR